MEAKRRDFGVDREQYFKAVRKGKERQGKRYLMAHLEGKDLTQRQAIYAMCYDCMGFYDDGMRDCEIRTCPLHSFMPYNPNKRKIATGGKGNPEALKKAREAKKLTAGVI